MPVKRITLNEIENIVKKVIKEYYDGNSVNEFFNDDDEIKNTSNNSIVTRGYEDFQNGLSLEDCPFEDVTDVHYDINPAEHWKFGWLSARDENKSL